jgi:hypothetical protein
MAQHQHASDETTSLRDALQAEAPDGALLHVRCTLAGRQGDVLRLTDGGVSKSMLLGRDRHLDSQHLMGTEVVATVLLRRSDREWRVIYVRSLEAFADWKRSRGREPALSVFNRYHSELNKLSREFSD